MDIRAIVSSTCDPAFAESLTGEIVAWNRAAERLLGYRASTVIGRKCWKVLRGRDAYENRYCGEHCPLLEQASSGEALHTAQMYFRGAGGERLQVSSCCLLVVDRFGPNAFLVHLLHPAEAGQEMGVEAGTLRLPVSRGRLTTRQQEILNLLADGRGTQEISDLLGISAATTRNHIQGILNKLKVHNRLEATILARRIGLI